MHDLHISGDVGEDGRLNEVALVTMALATSCNGGTALLALLDVAHDALKLKLADLGTLEGVLVEWVTDGVLLGTRLEGGDELVVDAFLNVDTRTGTAALTVVVVDTKVDPRDGLLDIGVIEDNVGGLATKFQGDLLQVGGGSSLHDGTTDKGRASEGNLVDVHVGRNSGTGNSAKAREDVDDSGRETSLLDQVGENQSGQRGLLSGLEDNGVAGGQGGADLPSQHQQRKVPGDDLAADTNLCISVSLLARGRAAYYRISTQTHRLLLCVVERFGVDVDGLAVNLIGKATIVSGAASNSANIATSQGNGLAIVEGLDSSQEVKVLLDEISKSRQVDATLLRGGFTPCCVESRAGSDDSDIDILLGGFVDGADNLLGGWVDDLERLLVDTCDPFVVDEPVRREQRGLVDRTQRMDGGLQKQYHLTGSAGAVGAMARWRYRICRDSQSGGLGVGAGDRRLQFNGQRHVWEVAME